MTVFAPVRSVDQRMAALARANAIRVRRATMKRELAAGTAFVTVLLADPPEWLASMRVLDLLKAMPGVGQIKAVRLMKVCRASHGKTVGGLSDRQRGELVAAIEARS